MTLHLRPIPPETVKSAGKAASARGLFRATGKKSKPVAIRDMLTGEIVKADSLARSADDFYPTPPEPTRSFLATEFARLRQFDGIWEPACGDGAMLREMHTVGLKTYASDIVQRGRAQTVRSFYDFGTAPFRAIVTNPPFSECGWGNGRARWLYHALDTLDIEYMALLMNWTWPGAGGLSAFWAKHPCARIYLMRWKIDFTGQGAPPMLNAWFVWDRTYCGETLLRMLDRTDPRQQEMFGAPDVLGPTVSANEIMPPFDDRGEPNIPEFLLRTKTSEAA